MEHLLWYIIIFLGILMLVLFFLYGKMLKKLNTLSGGKSAKSLEAIIKENHMLLNQLEREKERQEQKNISMEKTLASTIQHISMVRFDALGDSGGKQSFALGLMDGHKNGVVISSMYTRGSMNIFAKEIIAGDSKHKLTEEEKQVIR